MRLLVAALAFAAFALAGCGGTDSEETKVLKATMDYFGDDPKGFIPPINEEYPCAINRAKVQEQGTTPYPAIGGLCRWTIEKQAADWRVTFAEAWLCADFSFDVGGYPPCLEENGSHVWKWLVNADLTIVPLGDQGNYAPDMPQ